MTLALRTAGTTALAAGTGALGALALVAASALASPAVGAAAVLALGAGGFVVLFLPEAALLATAFVVPMERLGRFTDDLELSTFSVMRLVGLFALVAVVVQVFVRRQKIEFSAPLLLYGLLSLMAFASILYAFDREATQADAITMFGSFLMLVVLTQGVRTLTMVRWLTLAWLAATLLVGLYQIIDWHFDPALQEDVIGLAADRFSTSFVALSERDTLGGVRRAFGTTSNPAVYGINLLLALPFFFLYMRLARSWAGLVAWAAAIAVVLYNIFLTNTRAVLLYLVLQLAAVVATGLLRLTPWRVVLGIAALPVFAMVLPQSVWDRVLNPVAYEVHNATNLEWRFELWQAALRLIGDNWLGGIGVGNRTAIIAYLDPMRFEGDWIMSHNEFLQLGYELGLFGLGTFLAFLGATVAIAMRVARLGRRLGSEEWRWFGVAAAIALLTGPLFGLQVDVFHFPLKGWWLAAGLVVVAARLLAEEGRAFRRLPPRLVAPRVRGVAA